MMCTIIITSRNEDKKIIQQQIIKNNKLMKIKIKKKNNEYVVNCDENFKTSSPLSLFALIFQKKKEKKKTIF